MLTYGVNTDFMVEYVKIGEIISLKRLKYFVKKVVSIFLKEYLRKLNNDDIARLLTISDKRGFSSILGSIDCMY